MSDPSVDWGQAFGIYVHWPFCLAKCPYCDFNSHVRHGGVDQRIYSDALRAELRWFARQVPERQVSTVFFGGGTPSLMEPATVAAVIEEIQKLWPLAGDVEITLEANPTSVEAKNFAGYRTAGVNRLSVGVQALVDDDLKRLGRQHTAEEALAAFDLAARTFDRVSFDMIYARSRQTVDSWRSELSQALQHAGEHMSLYQLTIEPDTRFADLFEEGKLTVPQDEEALALFDVTQEMTDAAGLPAYEISNHARPGAECRHNLIYWNYGEYAGVGPGAHSRLRDTAGQRIAIDMQRTPEVWRGSVEQVGHGTENTTCLSAMDAAEEYLLMGLRLTRGIQAARYKELAGAGLNDVRLETLVAEGLLERRADSGTVRATARGKRVLNAVIAYLAGS